MKRIIGHIFIKKKRRRIFFILILLAVATEIALRLMGYGYKIVKAPQKPIEKGRFTILCIGESSTLGYGVHTKDNYPNQLEALLNAGLSDKKFQVFYDGSMGANSSRMLLVLPEYIKKYNPDLVILMLGINNHLDLDKSNIFLFSKNEKVSHYYYRVSVFLHKSRLFKLLKLIFYQIIHYQAKEWTPFDLENIPFHIDELFNKILRYDLTEIITICKYNDIKVLLSGYHLTGFPDLYLEIAKEQKVPFVDNRQSFNAFRENGTLKEYILSDNWHPNEKGYLVIAGNIYKILVEEKMVPLQH